MSLRIALLAGIVAVSAADTPALAGSFLEDLDVSGDMASGDTPSPPPAAPATEGVKMTFKASGDLSDYTDTVKDGIKEAFAKAAGVYASAVNVKVVGGSVQVTVTIAVPDSSSASAVTSALSSSTSNATALTALLDSAGVSFTVDQITSSFTVVAPPPPSSSSGLSSGAIAGIVIGSVVGAMILLFICYKAFRNLVDSPGGIPLVNRGYGESGGAVEIIGNKGAVDVI